MKLSHPLRSERIRLAVVEDENLVREGIVALFKAIPDIHVILAEGNRATALERAEASPPDVVLLDLTMPDANGERGLRNWKERLPSASLLLFDDRVRDVNVRMALKLRVAGYVTKTDRFVDILTAVCQCAAGETYFPEAVRKRLQITSRGLVLQVGHDQPGLHSLTDRETQVLALLAQGQSVKQCSETLGISPSTVDNHKARVMKKLNLHKTVELARLALREGLMFE